MAAISATCLLVEDEALVAMVAEDQLRALGYEPLCAASGAEAFALIDGPGAPPVFAMIDVGLPDMRGDDLASQLRSRLPEMKVILASGYDPITLKRRFQEDNAVSVVGKPYTEDDLRRALVTLGLTA